LKNVLHASLSPAEEIALRRVANGAPSIESAARTKLEGLVLVEATRRGLRLTPAGLQCYKALPKAPLLTRGRSVEVVSQYIDGLIEKAQSRRQRGTGSSIAQQTTVEHLVAEKAQETELPKTRPAAIHQGGSNSEQVFQHPASRRTDDPDARPPNADWKRYLLNARSSIDHVRRSISDHRKCHLHTCELSRKRIEASLASLRQTRLHSPALLTSRQSRFPKTDMQH
jgi:hypothetical protein